MSTHAERGHTLRIELDERRICISMDVLRQIGNPKYIQILINREKNTLFIRGCDKKEASSLAVPARVYTDTEYDYRLAKSAFAEAIVSLCNWDSQGKYRLYGTYYVGRIMRFSLHDVERLDADVEE